MLLEPYLIEQKMEIEQKSMATGCDLEIECSLGCSIEGRGNLKFADKIVWHWSDGQYLSSVGERNALRNGSEHPDQPNHYALTPL